MSRVSIVKCGDYVRENVEGALRRSVGLLGGIENFVKKGEKVLIKPNLLSARTPEEAVSTHPEVVRAVIRIVREAGGRPLVGDSPGSFFTTRDVDFVYEKTGIRDVAEAEGAELIKFSDSRVVNGYPIARAAMDCAAVISVPKLKTHMLTLMTGAVKNTFGLIPGLFKVECHRKRPRARDFVKILVDVFEIVRPRLFIMDAIVAMEGDGPSAGRPRGAGLLLAGADGVDVDAVAAELIGLAPRKNIVLNEARRRHLGSTDIDGIEIAGEGIEDVRMDGFRLPKTAGIINALPGFVASIFKRLVKFSPVINEELCVKCGVCERSCPAGAITIDETVSRVDDRRCVRCFCCHEVCPRGAIYIKKNFLTDIFWRNENAGGRDKMD